MRIAFVITGLSAGGAEMMLLKLLQKLDRRRFEPHVISLTTIGDLGPRIAMLGIPVDTLEMSPGFPSVTPLLTLIKKLKQIQPDVVHTWMYHADLLGGLAARIAGIKSIVWCIRNSNLDKNLTGTTTRVIVKLCAFASRWIPDRIISCSERARQIHQSLGYAPGKFAVIPNGFDLTKFRPDPLARRSVREELGVNQETPLVGLIGRLDPQKNHAGFLEAAGIVHQRLPETHFVLVGKDAHPANPILVSAATAAGVLPNTRMLGLRDDIPRLMASLDVLVSSSSYGEAFPNVVGEAMATGIPCVVTDVGDSGHIVGSTGRIVAPGDMPKLAQGIREILELPCDGRENLARTTRRRIEDHFTIERIALQYEAVYEEIASAYRCRVG